ncbi:hypothetical protein CHD23_00790 [Salmonella enterica]|nr:hypothetical protein CHD23_00790 [Salmonella enterica]
MIAFFIVKFHYAKSDFKYNDQKFTDQRAGLFFKFFKINKLYFFSADRELKHTLRYHQIPTARGSGSNG